MRTCAADSLRKLSDDLPVQTGVEHPKYYLLKIILAARLPYWVSNSSTRGARQVSDAVCHILLLIPIASSITALARVEDIEMCSFRLSITLGVQ